MKYRLMDLLACPICKHFPLKLIVFEESEIKRPEKIRRCELYCGYHQAMVKDLSELNCEDCWSKEIVNGILICEKCGRWYPISEEIPRMLPDDLRNRNEDLKFLSRWRSRIPEAILNKGKPFNLGNPWRKSFLPWRNLTSSCEVDLDERIIFRRCDCFNW